MPLPAARPSLGHRARLPQLGYRRLSAAGLYRDGEPRDAVKILIESPLGIENIAAIAALPGVDMIAIGTNDLSAELGVPGEFAPAGARRASSAAIAACKQAGKPLAIGGIGDAAYCAELIATGRGALPHDRHRYRSAPARAQARATRALGNACSSRSR